VWVSTKKEKRKEKKSQNTREVTTKHPSALLDYIRSTDTTTTHAHIRRERENENEIARAREL
jgi:hypothetical protein